MTLYKGTEERTVAKSVTLQELELQVQKAHSLLSATAAQVDLLTQLIMQVKGAAQQVKEQAGAEVPKTGDAEKDTTN